MPESRNGTWREGATGGVPGVRCRRKAQRRCTKWKFAAVSAVCGVPFSTKLAPPGTLTTVSVASSAKKLTCAKLAGCLDSIWNTSTAGLNPVMTASPETPLKVAFTVSAAPATSASLFSRP